MGRLLVLVDLGAHRECELTADRMLILAEAHEHGAAKRLTIHNLQARVSSVMLPRESR